MEHLSEVSFPQQSGLGAYSAFQLNPLGPQQHSQSQVVNTQSPYSRMISRPQRRTRRRRHDVDDMIPDELWECVLCSVKSHMTPLKRRGEDGKRVGSQVLMQNLCNACYVRLRVRKERSERGTSRPVLPQATLASLFTHLRMLWSEYSLLTRLKAHM